MCTHTPSCPPPGDHDRAAAHIIATHPEQGWSLLCNGMVVFFDGGELFPPGVSKPEPFDGAPGSPGCPQSAGSAAPADGPRGRVLAAGGVR